MPQPYKLNLYSTSITRVYDGAFISADPANADYATYLKWLDAGNTPTPADIPVPVIAPVTPRQIRLALNQLGLRSAVDAYISAASQDVKDTWEFASVIERNSPLIAAGAAELGLTEAQIDDLFALAASL
mgnify:CR=1 FL=1